MKLQAAHHDLAVVAVLQARIRLTHLTRVLSRDHVSFTDLDARLLALCDVLAPLVTALENILPEPGQTVSDDEEAHHEIKRRPR